MSKRQPNLKALPLSEAYSLPQNDFMISPSWTFNTPLIPLMNTPQVATATFQRGVLENLNSNDLLQNFAFSSNLKGSSTFLPPMPPSHLNGVDSGKFNSFSKTEQRMTKESGSPEKKKAKISNIKITQKANASIADIAPSISNKPPPKSSETKEKQFNPAIIQSLKGKIDFETGIVPDGVKLTSEEIKVARAIRNRHSAMRSRQAAKEKRVLLEEKRHKLRKRLQTLEQEHIDLTREYEAKLKGQGK